MEPDEVLKLVDAHWLDRRTKLDDLMAESVLLLSDIKSALSGVPPGAPPGEKIDYYFSYPQDGSKKDVTAGVTSINYINGQVKLPTGTTDSLADKLENYELKYVRSFMISTDQEITVRMDSRDAIPIPANAIIPFPNQQFSVLNIETVADSTNIYVLASTGNVSIPPSLAVRKAGVAMNFQEDVTVSGRSSSAVVLDDPDNAGTDYEVPSGYKLEIGNVLISCELPVYFYATLETASSILGNYRAHGRGQVIFPEYALTDVTAGNNLTVTIYNTDEESLDFSIAVNASEVKA